MKEFKHTSRSSIPSVFGLNDWAEKFVAKARKKLLNESARLFEAGRPLYQYIFPNGQIYYEKIQPQTRRLNQFLALQNKNDSWVVKSLWTNSEIDEICSFL